MFSSLVIKLANNNLLNWMSDELYLKTKYRAVFGKKLRLDEPVTYNEKLQWLKLHDRKPEYSAVVDKYEVKRIVSERIGEEYVIPTIGLWNSPDEIDFESLPESFVLKCTHDSGGSVICRDKSKLDMNAAIKYLKEAFKQNYFWKGREWPYKSVKPRVLAETYMEDSATGELRDYKFFCFDGKVKGMFIATDRGKPVDTKFDFFDAEGNHLDIRQGHPNAESIPALPINFDKMKELAEELSKGYIQIRVDFYEADGRAYFGEMTLSHFDGMMPFVPEEWDEVFGSYIKLPKQ